MLSPDGRRECCRHLRGKSAHASFSLIAGPFSSRSVTASIFLALLPPVLDANAIAAGIVALFLIHVYARRTAFDPNGSHAVVTLGNRAISSLSGRSVGSGICFHAVRKAMVTIWAILAPLDRKSGRGVRDSPHVIAR
jgi:hypothetical protein